MKVAQLIETLNLSLIQLQGAKTDDRYVNKDATLPNRHQLIRDITNEVLEINNLKGLFEFGLWGLRLSENVCYKNNPYGVGISAAEDILSYKVDFINDKRIVYGSKGKINKVEFYLKTNKISLDDNLEDIVYKIAVNDLKNWIEATKECIEEEKEKIKEEESKLIELEERLEAMKLLNK